MNIANIVELSKEYEKLTKLEKELKSLLYGNLCTPRVEARVLGYCSYVQTVRIDEDIFKVAVKEQLNRVTSRLSEIKSVLT